MVSRYPEEVFGGFMSIRDSIYRISATLFGIRETAMAVPVLAGPARGLWLRTETAGAEVSQNQKVLATSKRTTHLSQYVQRGWTVWDCSGEAGISTILFAKFVGQEGLVVAFEPERNHFMRTYDNATLNGCNNIFFLFAAIGEPAPKKAFAPPICARQLSLDEAYQDGEIPIPQLVRLDLAGPGESALHHCRQLVSEQRPFIVVDKYRPESERAIKSFAAEYRYDICSLDTNQLVEGEITGSVILRPSEKR